MSLVKGRSDSAELDLIAQSVHLLLFSLQCSLWLEWVLSKSNWTSVAMDFVIPGTDSSISPRSVSFSGASMFAFAPSFSPFSIVWWGA